MSTALLEADVLAALRAANRNEIFVHELYTALQQPTNLLLLDVRNEEEFQMWRIETRHTPETLHLPYFFFLEEEEKAVDQVKERVQDGRPVVVVCAKGGASDYVAERLREANTLLRAASAPESPTETLLRPASGSADVDPSNLLRPASSTVTQKDSVDPLHELPLRQVAD